MQTYFITANDTDVGKTYVAGLLARHFATQGLSVQMIKAIDCGGSGDAAWVQAFAGDDLVSTHTLFSYPEPLAPLAAANCAQSTPDFSQLLHALEQLPVADVRLIEGAGGLAVPIDRSGLDWRDFAEALAPDRTLVVVDNRLGAINQSRLVDAYLGDLPHAFILNELQPASDAVKASNLEAYAQFKFDLLALLNPGSEALLQLDAALLDAPKVTQAKRGSALPQQRLEARKAKHSFRAIQVPDFPASTLNLSDNDYLNLRHHPAVAEAAKVAIDQHGTSTSASPLITGYTAAHAELEQTVSDWYGGATALIWNSGYAANQSILKLFVQPDDLVLADRMIHNSLISGILQSGARLVRFQHNDLAHLESLLKKHAGRKVHVVTESVYSMDGDYPDLQQLAALRSEYGFSWYLDEAHALGWYGATGSGLAEAAGVADQVDILTGTLGKALASSGAYTVFREPWMRDLCINEAGEFIYSTYLPASSAAAATAAIGLIREQAAARPAWRSQAQALRESLRAQGWDVLGEDSPIIPVICGDSARALDMAARFLQAGLKVAAIRPPTVSPGAARLRLSLKSSLNEGHCRQILNCFEESRSTHV